MSPLARGVATTTLALLAVQFVGMIVLQMAMASSFRTALITELYRDLEGSGLFEDCIERPGPWRLEGHGRSAWPVAPDGAVVGDSAPAPHVALPPPGHTRGHIQHGRLHEVYASTSPGCGGVLHVVDRRTPALEFFRRGSPAWACCGFSSPCPWGSRWWH